MILNAAAKAVDEQGVVGLIECFGWEAFLERPTVGQRGYWIDLDWSRCCFRLGLGGAILCVARLP